MISESSFLRMYGASRFASPLAVLLLAVLLLAGALTGWSAPPTLDHLHPAGGARGTTNRVVVAGKADPWPVRAVVQGAGVDFTATTNARQFEVRIADDALPGPRLVRLVGPEGASDPRVFVVGDGPELSESEPNNHFRSAQALSQLPLTVNGRLDKNGDVDSFSIPLRRGQWLETALDAYTLMSKFDAVFRLVDSAGTTLAWNHDAATLDPRLVWRSPSDQSVVLQIFGFKYPADSAIQLTGGEGAVYRLHVATAETPPPGHRGPGADADSRDDGPASTDDGIPVLPLRVQGSLTRDDEVRRHPFALTTAETLVASVRAAALGSPLDAWLRIEDSSGRQLAYNDDAEGRRDPRLEWRAPTNGTYVAVVGSLTRGPGNLGFYELALSTEGPDFGATVDASSLVLAAGSTNHWTAKISRKRGHTNELHVAITGLPEGVTAPPAIVRTGEGEARLSLVADAHAPAFAGPVKWVLTDVVDGRMRGATFELVSQGENNGVPQGYQTLLVERTDEFWLTVTNTTPMPATNGPPASAASAGP